MNKIGRLLPICIVLGVFLIGMELQGFAAASTEVFAKEGVYGSGNDLELKLQGHAVFPENGDGSTEWFLNIYNNRREIGFPYALQEAKNHIYLSAYYRVEKWRNFRYYGATYDWDPAPENMFTLFHQDCGFLTSPGSYSETHGWSLTLGVAYYAAGSFSMSYSQTQTRSSIAYDVVNTNTISGDYRGIGYIRTYETSWDDDPIKHTFYQKITISGEIAHDYYHGKVVESGPYTYYYYIEQLRLRVHTDYFYFGSINDGSRELTLGDGIGYNDLDDLFLAVGS